MFPGWRILVAVIALGGVLLMAGCGGSSQPTGGPSGGTSAGKKQTPGGGKGGPGDGSDPHDVVITEKDVARPADFKDAVKRIRGYRDSIERDAASDTPGKAHRGLDELDFVLQWLPGIARDTHVPKEHWEAVNTTAQDLRTQFDKVHTAIDNRQPPNFAGVQPAIDAGIARLEKIAGQPASP